MHGVNYLRNYFKNKVYHRDYDVLIELNIKMSTTLTVETQIPFKLIGFTIDNRKNKCFNYPQGLQRFATP
jgi:hypothetical protein